MVSSYCTALVEGELPVFLAINQFKEHFIRMCTEGQDDLAKAKGLGSNPPIQLGAEQVSNMLQSYVNTIWLTGNYCAGSRNPKGIDVKDTKCPCAYDIRGILHFEQSCLLVTWITVKRS